MFNISKYLEKFSKNVESLQDYNKKIIETIKNHTGLDVDPTYLELKNNIIYINSSPAVKNKLFIYKEDILKDINTTIGIKISDIR